MCYLYFDIVLLIITFIMKKKKKKIFLSGGIEPPFRDSESHVITTTLQEMLII